MRIEPPEYIPDTCLADKPESNFGIEPFTLSRGWRKGVFTFVPRQPMAPIEVKTKNEVMSDPERRGTVGKPNSTRAGQRRLFHLAKLRNRVAVGFAL